MPFIGQQPTTGTFVELDSLTASATADYTLQLNGANYYPESVNNLLVSINGVIQGSNTMSLSGSTLTVGATLSSSDVIDFVRVFGNVGTISTPTDGSVTVNKLGTGAVTNAKIADSTIDLTSKVTGVLPVANGGSGVSSVPSFFAYNDTNDWISNITANTDIVLDATKHNVGNHYSTTTGKFTAPVTGVYSFQANFYTKNDNGKSKFYAALDGTIIHHDNTGYPLIHTQKDDSDSNDETIGMSWCYYMTANQTMHIKSGDSVSDYFGSMTYFSGFYIGG